MPPELGALGVWWFNDTMTSSAAAEFATRIEQLGYGTLWMPETTGRDPFAHSAYLFSRTSHLNLATGIANVHHRHPGMMKQAALTLAEQSGGRFVLGVGVSHARMVEGTRGLKYEKPMATMRAYLEAMRSSPYTALEPTEAHPIVVAALGPRMLELAAAAADGAHPYLTTPEHTARASEIIGPNKMLCVEQKLVLCTDAAEARSTARRSLARYLALPNYYRNWFRLGFDESDLQSGGSNRLVDALFAWGNERVLRDRIEAHQRAGATHVCIQPLLAGGRGGQVDWKALEALAPR